MTTEHTASAPRRRRVITTFAQNGCLNADAKHMGQHSPYGPDGNAALGNMNASYAPTSPTCRGAPPPVHAAATIGTCEELALSNYCSRGTPSSE